MPRPSPKIDPRTYADLVAETERLAEDFSGWRSPDDSHTDAGRALIRIFGRMATLVSDRLNRVPEKHFLAFLNLIGAEQQPPRAARVPITAYLVDDSPVDTLLPAQTPIAAVSPTGEEVLFETEQDLVVMRSQLQSMIVHSGDRWCDHFPMLNNDSVDFPVFSIETANTLYIAADQLTTKPDSQKIQLAIAAADQFIEGWRWSYWNGKSWQTLTAATLESNRLQLINPGEWSLPQPKTIEQMEAHWLRAIAPEPEDSEQVAVLAAAVQFVQADTGEQPPEQAFFNTENIDFSKDFFPLGETPAFNDTLYIASQQCLHLPNQQVTLHCEPSEGITPRPSNEPAPEIVWETWNGQTWASVLVPGSEAPLVTHDWPTTTSLQLPPTVAPTQVNGETNYWLRARLIKGNYGSYTRLESREYTLEFLESEPTSGRGQVIVRQVETDYYVHIFDWSGNRLTADHLDSTGKVGSTDDTSALRAALNDAIAAPPADQRALLQQLQTTLNVTLAPHLAFASDANVGYAPPSLKSLKLQLAATPLVPKRVLSALPSGDFVYTTADSGNQLYLRFDRPFPNQGIALYLQVSPPAPGTLPDTPPPVTPAKLQWEYTTADPAEGWHTLTVQDGTKNLSQRGMVEFIGPTDFVPQTYFGQSGYWLRLRKTAGDFAVPPQLQQIRTNTVWATQATTYTDEIVGSGTGDPGLTVRSLHTPILPGQQLLVREAERLSTDEQAAIERLEGEEAIAMTLDDAGQPTEIWVRWHQVSDFYGSGSRDRHYTLDRLTGEIRFGGETQGLAPPRGRNNIRLAYYQSGGGQPGNCKAGTVTELKTTVPYVDRVTNLEPAGGGADVEPIANVQASAPKQLRHRDRAVTWQDIEDLTYAASSEIARVKVIPPQIDPSEGFQWLPIFPIELSQAGQIEVQATLTEAAAFSICLYGPGQTVPYQQVPADPNELVRAVESRTLIYDVSPEEWIDDGSTDDLKGLDAEDVATLKPAAQWTVQLELAQTGTDSRQYQGQIIITTPDGETRHDLALPPQSASSDQSGTRNPNPFTDVTDAGQVTVLIVPQSSQRQPTPSLALREQVQRYLTERLDPALTLSITEPPWVQVTVEAAIAPRSETANQLPTVVGDALTAFLHPLTGGFNGTGWPFGRRPHESDLYAFIERLPEVSHVVGSINVGFGPNRTDSSVWLSQLNPNDRDRFLIYSGQHQITITAPP